jgi:hypothetical protein
MSFGLETNQIRRVTAHVFCIFRSETSHKLGDHPTKAELYLPCCAKTLEWWKEKGRKQKGRIMRSPMNTDCIVELSVSPCNVLHFSHARFRALRIDESKVMFRELRLVATVIA